jgi:nucleoside-diphosphate-sugar epimerase
VLVTGASGFIGRAVCRRLAERGWSVRAAARRPVEAPPAGEVFATGDLTEFRSWTPLLEGCGAVVHLANAAHVRARSADEMTSARRLNVDATLRLAEAAARAGTRRFLYVSTVKVHGEETPAGRPFTEVSALQPGDPYARLKAEAEEGLRVLARQASFGLTILRPPLVYGPGVKANFLALLRLVALRLPLPFAALDNRRSLVFVGNLADAIARCLEPSGAASQAYLVADGPAVSTPQLCRALGDALGRRAWLFRCAPRLLERLPAMHKLTRSLELDDSAIRRDLGWQAPFSFDEGLRATASWYLGAAR